MPQFILNVGNAEAGQWLATLDDFAFGYVEALFFTETANEEDLEDASVAELSPQARQEIEADCAAFQAANAGDLEQACNHPDATYDRNRAGTDYWFTRNRHGAGFWDRGLGPIGTALTEAAHADGSQSLYRGDDGMLHLS